MKNLLNLLFPNLCNGCDTLLMTNERTLCLTCRHDLPLTPHLHIPENETFKKFYGKIPVEYAASIAYFHKEGVVQQLIHNLKYKGKEEIGSYFGEFYAPALCESSCFESVDCIIPVPLHPKKLRERGYNQVTAFGKSLAQGMDKEFVDTLLFRNQYSRTQTKKNLAGRSEIGTELFEAKHTAAFHGKHFLLVDDVITTGSTLEACAKALLKIPGVKISILTIGYAQS